MAIRYITEEELERLAKSVWYAPKTKAGKCGDGEKYASMNRFDINGKSTQFPMRADEWKSAGAFEVKIEYPMWDIPGKIFVRKLQGAGK